MDIEETVESLIQQTEHFKAVMTLGQVPVT